MINSTELSAAAIVEALAAADITVTARQAEQLSRFYTAVTEKNQVMNLTAITAPDEFLRKHYLDALWGDESAQWNQINAALDLGTGAGFPGIPLAIMHPDTCWTLLDATAKKLRFLEETAMMLGLKNVSVLHGRAEEVGQNVQYRERFDRVTSRAVASLSVLAEWALPLVKVGGSFWAYKGPKAEEEIRAASQAIEILGGTVTDIDTSTLPGSTEMRTVIRVTKVSPTPSAYPRPYAKTKKRPL